VLYFVAAKGGATNETITFSANYNDTNMVGGYAVKSYTSELTTDFQTRNIILDGNMSYFSEGGQLLISMSHSASSAKANTVSLINLWLTYQREG